ncbi:thermonuclease family protein [archaeon]|nr:thermonuclease family protein [archaeon]
MANPPYIYDAKIVKVIDGDTFDFEIDLGFSIRIKERMRLYGVNTPETKGIERPEGIRVKKYVSDKILNKTFEILVYKKGKYGRYVSDLMLTKKERLSVHLYKKKMAKKITYDKAHDIEKLLNTIKHD